jgi:hypothetical protein
MAELPDRFLAALARCGGSGTLQDVVAALSAIDRTFAAGVITHDLVACARCLCRDGAVSIEYDAKARVDVIRAK